MREFLDYWLQEYLGDPLDLKFRLSVFIEIPLKQ